jgi:dihydroorotate dehydrogenase
VNVGKNKDTITDPASDFVFGILSLGKYADYIVVNISSPNTPGLRSLQRKEELSGLIVRCQAAQKEVRHEFYIPLLGVVKRHLLYEHNRLVIRLADTSLC